MQIALLLLAVVLLLFLVMRRKKAEQRSPAKPEPAPAAALEAAGASEQYGPSLDEVEHEEPEIAPAPEVEPEPELVVNVEPEPFVVPEVVAEPDPVVEVEPEPISLTHHSEPVAIEPEPEPEPVAPGPEPDRVLDISYPSIADAPPGLSVDAFKDVKPVSFGGIAVEETTPAPEAAPGVRPEPEPIVDVHPEPIVEAAPARDFEPLTYPGVEELPPVELEPEPMPEPEPEMAAAVAEPAAAEPVAEDSKPKKRGLRISNPELKLPSFGKLPQITLPANLQGPLTDVERKIALGCVLAIVVAGAFGYKTAPSDDAGTPAPAPAPAAASR